MTAKTLNKSKLASWSLMVLVASLVIFGLSSPNTVQASEAWSPNVDSMWANGQNPDYQPGDELLYIEEEGNDGGTVVTALIHGTDTPIKICTELGPDLDCNTGELVDIGHRAVLPVCSGVLENCIESLEVAQGDGSFEKAQYSFTPEGVRFEGNPNLGVPNGTLPSTFRSSIANSETNDYTVEANLNFSLQNFSASKHEFNAAGFYVRIQASKPVIRKGLLQSKAMFKDGQISVQESQGCIYQDTDLCGVAVDFAPSTSFRVTMVLTDKLTGWFRGRMSNPDISIEPAGPGYIRVSVSGDPVNVPRFVSVYASRLGDPGYSGDHAHGGAYTIFNSASTNAMSLINLYRDKLKDTAAGVSTVWSMTSISGNQAAANSPEAGRCLESNSKVLGIVTTNATAYTGAIPEFDAGYLTYKVAGLHYEPDGVTPNLGTYDMVMRSETARCLYGFTKAPVSATVAVLGEMGSENIATTIVSEKDGWLKLAAYGFTFSEKKIQMKLTQPFTKTITKFSGSSKALTSKQKAEIKATVAKAKSNPKFICTGTYVKASSKATALARARAACNYARSLDKNHSYFAQAKQTAAKSYDAKVMLVSK